MSVQDSTPYVLVCERSRGRCAGRSFPDRLRTVLPDPSGLVVGAVSCSPLLGFSARPRLNSKPAPRPRDNLTLFSRPETGCPATARDAGISLRANSGDASSPRANPGLATARFCPVQIEQPAPTDAPGRIYGLPNFAPRKFPLTVGSGLRVRDRHFSGHRGARQGVIAPCQDP